MPNNKWQAYAQRGRGGRGRGHGLDNHDNRYHRGSDGGGYPSSFSSHHWGSVEGNRAGEGGGSASRVHTSHLSSRQEEHADPGCQGAAREEEERYEGGVHEEDQSTSTTSLEEWGRTESPIPAGGERRRFETTNLLHFMQSMDGCGYGQLKSLAGRSFFLPFTILPESLFPSSAAPNENNVEDPGIVFTFLQVQSDPFAPGSVVEVEFSLPFKVGTMIYLPCNEAVSCKKTGTASDGQHNGFAVHNREEETRRTAAEDFLLRAWRAHLFGQTGDEDEVESDDGRQSVEEASANDGGVQGRGKRRGRAVEVIRISPHVLPRSAVQLDPALSLARFYFRVKLPGHGRRIDAFGICRMLREDVLRSTALLWGFLQRKTEAKQMHALSFASVCRDHLSILHTSESGKELLLHYMDHIDDQEWLRCQLLERNLAAFVINGSILPRAAGNSDKPMKQEECVCFASPPSMAFSFLLPRTQRSITGMGLPRAGLTLIAGGGFHGKSTLLRGLELGIYNHIPSDGRAFVVTDPTAVKIRAEDRRSVHGVNIESFISNLPFGKDTSRFVTSEASGSTSQAANIMEALELGAHTLLLDEDTSATNLMYRDDLVQSLVPAQDEPITSLVERIRVLLKEKEVSVILVVGGSGQYFQHADKVIVMKNYLSRDATTEAKEIARRQLQFSLTMKLNAAGGHETMPSTATVSGTSVPPFGLPPVRHLDPLKTFSPLSVSAKPLYRGRGRGGRPTMLPSSANGNRNERIKIGASSAQRIRCADEEIDLSLVEQLVEEGQLQAIAQCVALCYDKGNKWVEEMQRGMNDHRSQVPRREGEKNLLFLHGDAFPTLSSHSPPSLLPLSLVSSQKTVSFPLGLPSNFARLVWSCEWALRRAQLELQTPSAYIPKGFTSLPRVMEIGAALNRLRTLYTKPL